MEAAETGCVWGGCVGCSGCLEGKRMKDVTTSAVCPVSCQRVSGHRKYNDVQFLTLSVILAFKLIDLLSWQHY